MSIPKHPLLSVVKSYRGLVGIVTCLSVLALIVSFRYISGHVVQSVYRPDAVTAAARRYAARHVTIQRGAASAIKPATSATVRRAVNFTPAAPRVVNVTPAAPALPRVVTPAVPRVTARRTPSPRQDIAISSRNATYPVTIGRPYLLENPTLCSSVSNLSALVIVHTAPGHFERRDAMRRTWTNNTYFQHIGHIRVLFLLGLAEDANTQIQILTEFAMYSDILQGDFTDSYRNLTLKGVMAYKWIAERCSNAQLILKVDDDVIVDTYRFLLDYLPKLQHKQKQILCNHILPGTMPIIRKRQSKWFVRDTEFRGQKFYPRYCSGFIVILTNDAIPAIYNSAKVTPFFWVDDVYLYGLLPSKVQGVKYSGLPRGSFTLMQNEALKCYRNATRKCNYLVTGAGNPSVVEEIWAHMTANYVRRHISEHLVNVNSREQTTHTAVTDAKVMVNAIHKQMTGDENVRITPSLSAHTRMFVMGRQR